jgi:hypothetical protein
VIVGLDVSVVVVNFFPAALNVKTSEPFMVTVPAQSVCVVDALSVTASRNDPVGAVAKVSVANDRALTNIHLLTFTSDALS